MRLHTASLCALAMAAAAFQAQAQQPSVGHVDAYYIPKADLEVSEAGFTGDDDGDGFGLRGRFNATEQVFISAEYQAVEYDDSSLELDQLRVGAGYILPINTTLNFVGQVEYISAETDGPGISSETDDGFGVHAGLEAALAPQFSLYGSVGFVSIDDSDGPEFLVGARFQVAPNVSLFADYRATRFSDSGSDLDLDDLRLGAGFHF
jgi:hypothetical protein